MNESILTRITAPAAVAAVAIGVPGDLYHLTIDSRAEEAHTLLFKTHGWMLTVAVGLMVVVLAGIVLRLAGRDNRIGPFATVVTALTFAGTLLVLGNISTEAFAMPQAGEAVSDPAGYWLAVVIASFALFGFGWAATGLVAARAGVLSWRVAALLAVGGVVAFTPIPGSYLVLFISVGIVGLTIAKRSLVAEEMTAPLQSASA